MTHVNPLLVQTNFRARVNTGNEATATWIAALNINWMQVVDADFRVRLEVDETATSTNAVNLDPQLFYELNGTGGFLAVTGSTPIQYATFTGATDGDATTQQIGSGSFVASELDSDGTIGTSSIQGSGTETEWCLTIDSAQVADADTIVLRVFHGASALDTYSNEPMITVDEPGGVDTDQLATLSDSDRTIGPVRAHRLGGVLQ